MSNKNLNKKLVREKGVFFTDNSVSEEASITISELVKPDVILEPFAGDGSLIKSFSKDNKSFIINDVNSDFILKAQHNLKGRNIHIFNENFITTPLNSIIDNWELPKGKEKFLIYSNPPFGTVSTNRLAMNKKDESGKSRSITIEYSNLEEYGKGDLAIPAIGKMIKVLLANRSKESYLAFFSPFGIFCGRKRYQKLLTAILRDFDFLFGKIYPGNKFQNVSKNKPISLTIWKLNKSINTGIEDLIFSFEEKKITLKRSKLLNEYWRYDTRKFIRGEIVAQGNDRFNVVAPKMLHLEIKKGGSELVPENVKKPLNIDNIPDELIFGLWSCAVGHRSLTGHPLYMDNAYVHLPDFSKTEIQEILIYTLLSILIIEMNNNYTKGKITIFNGTQEITFGGDNLTKGANHLLKMYNNLEFGNKTVHSFLKIMKNNVENPVVMNQYRPTFKKEIEKRLIKTGYWNHIPISESF
ncbi:MAG: hypothetical protein ACW981_18195 [Candidatus Hodarchaeales archaeon]|jgi:hypothetical protein